MLYVESVGLTQSAVKDIEHFGLFAFSQTRYNDVIIRFQQFDDSGLCKAFVQEEKGNLLVYYNRNDNDSLDKIREVLAHESIHARQLSEGRLQYTLMRTDAGIKWGFLWDGTLYRPPENAEQFIALPWEIEAYGGTQGVLELYGIQQRSRENIEVEKIF